MKIQVNTEIISKLNPCTDRFDNWKWHYEKFDGGIIDFLDLENISFSDKIWVAVRLMPRFEVEVFAIDCAVSAAAADAADAAADAAYAAYAADAYAAYASAYAAYAAYAAADASDAYAADAAERERQIEALKYLIETSDEKEGVI